MRRFDIDNFHDLHRIKDFHVFLQKTGTKADLPGKIDMAFFFSNRATIIVEPIDTIMEKVTFDVKLKLWKGKRPKGNK